MPATVSSEWMVEFFGINYMNVIHVYRLPLPIYQRVVPQHNHL